MASSPQQRTAASFGGTLQARVAALVGRPLFWASFFAVACLVLLGRTMTRQLPTPPKLNLPLPSFQLIDQDGRPFGTEQLRGKVWVASFIFTSCPTVCPKLTARMAQLQQRGR